MRAATIVSLAVLLAFTYVIPIQAENPPVKAMWVWDFYTSASTEAQREQLIHFSLEHNINLLFVGTKHTLSSKPEDYADLIQRARESGIRVFALLGGASWAWEEHHPAALEQIGQVLDYNAAHPSLKFEGIQLDIEPYTLPHYWADTELVNLQFLRLLQNAAQLVEDRGEDLELNAAIPFWYATGMRSMMVEHNGVSQALSYHILDIVDSVSIMAYRNNATAQIEVSKAEIEYADNIGKKVYVGAETKPSDGDAIPKWITYHDKDARYLNEQLEAINRHYLNNPGFGGVAIHAYDYFKAMQHETNNTNNTYQLQQQFSELQAAGLLTGYPDGTAGFGKTASRAEVAVIAARIGGYSDTTLYKPVSASFIDVAPKLWSYGWIETAHKMGVMKGKGNRRFDPHSNITLEEALIVTARTIGVTEAKAAFVPGASDWAQGWVQAMIHEGLIDKRTSYTDEMTREDLVSLVYEMYRLRINQGGSPQLRLQL